MQQRTTTIGTRVPAFRTEPLWYALYLLSHRGPQETTDFTSLCRRTARHVQSNYRFLLDYRFIGRLPIYLGLPIYPGLLFSLGIYDFGSN